MSAPNSSETQSPIKHFPAWFTAIFALVFLSGYLVDYFYFSGKGIADTGGDLLKLKFVHVGVVYVILTFCLSALPYYFFDSSKPRRNETARVSSESPQPAGTPTGNGYPSVVPVVTAAAAAYWLSILFAVLIFPPAYFTSHIGRAIALITIIGTFVPYTWLLSRAPPEEWKSESFTGRRKLYGVVIVSLILVLGSALFYEAFLCPDSKPKIGSAKLAIAIYISSCVGIAAVLIRARILLLRLAEKSGPEFLRIVGQTTCTFSVLTFCSLYFYAQGIYPLIPSTRGGTNFDDTQLLTIEKKEGGALHNVLVVYTTERSIIVSSCEWMTSERPIFTQLSRDVVKSIDVAGASRCGAPGIVEAGPG